LSLEVLLIPLGIAAVAAIREARSTSLCEKCHATNVADQALLITALDGIGATAVAQSDGRVTCDSTFGSLTFQRIGEVFLGRVDGGTHSQTATMISAVSAAAGRIAQARMVQIVQERASDMGLTLITQKAEDGTVQLVYEVNR